VQGTGDICSIKESPHRDIIFISSTFSLDEKVAKNQAQTKRPPALKK